MAKPSEVLSNNPKEDIAPISPYGAVEYSINADALAKLAKQSAGIKEVNSVKDVAAIMPYIAALRDTRLKIDKERKVLKAGAIAHGKLVESEANTRINIIQPEETRLQAIRKKFEDIAAEAKQKKIEAERRRTGKHRTFIEGIVDIPAKLIRNGAGLAELEQTLKNIELTDFTVFEEFSKEATGAATTAVSVIKGMIALEKQKAEQEMQRLRNEQAVKAQKEQQRQLDAQEKENEEEAERLKQQKADQAAKVESDKQAAAQKVIDDKAAAKQKIIDDKEAVKQKKIDDKAAAAVEKKRKEEIAASKPDAEKLRVLANTILEIEMPELQIHQYVITGIRQDIDKLGVSIRSIAEDLIS